MPLAAKNNLDELYARQRLVENEAERLECERERLELLDAEADRCYLLAIESSALREEATKLNAAIADILERDLLR